MRALEALLSVGSPWLAIRLSWGLVGLGLLLIPIHGKAETSRTRGARPGSEGRSAPGDGTTIRVRPGDTLWSLAHAHGLSVEALKGANRLPDASLRAGQHLVVPARAIAGSRAGPRRGVQEPPSPAEIVLGAPTDAPALTLAWPVPGPVLSGFGRRGRGWHGGLDLSAVRGTPIQAAAPGMVVAAGRESGYGNVVKIWHHHDLMTVYAHNQENRVRVGDWVETGQVVGTVGSTGRATAPHLHFEVRLRGMKYEPRYWLGPAWSAEVMIRSVEPGASLR